MMHQVARDALHKQFRQAAHCASRPAADRAYFLGKVDEILDQFLSWELLATEWDADKWGLDPDGWMGPERQELRRRACGRDPVEPMMRVKS